MGEKKSSATKHQKWYEVKRDIECKIIKGTYTAGSQIITLEEMKHEYGIGRTTAQKVIEALDEEGTIIRKAGVGCFVRPFVREKLLKEQQGKLKSSVVLVVTQAKDIGLGDAEIIALVTETMDEFENKN